MLLFAEYSTPIPFFCRISVLVFFPMKRAHPAPPLAPPGGRQGGRSPPLPPWFRRPCLEHNQSHEIVARPVQSSRELTYELNLYYTYLTITLQSHKTRGISVTLYYNNWRLRWLNWWAPNCCMLHVLAANVTNTNSTSKLNDNYNMGNKRGFVTCVTVCENHM